MSLNPSDEELAAKVAFSCPIIRTDDVPYVIYFAQCQRFMKIGISHNIDLRKLGSTDNPFDVAIRMLVGARKVSARITERYLHQHFRKAHHKGEWFRILTPEVRAIRRDVEILVARIDDLSDFRFAEHEALCVAARVASPAVLPDAIVDQVAVRSQHAQRLCRNSRRLPPKIIQTAPLKNYTAHINSHDIGDT